MAKVIARNSYRFESGAILIQECDFGDEVGRVVQILIHDDEDGGMAEILTKTGQLVLNVPPRLIKLIPME